MSGAHDFIKERRVSGAHENDERTKGLPVFLSAMLNSFKWHYSINWEILPKLAKNKKNSKDQNSIFSDPSLVGKVILVGKTLIVRILKNFLS